MIFIIVEYNIRKCSSIIKNEKGEYIVNIDENINKLSNSSADYLVRPRLDNILDQATLCKLVYVIAGAGYGKTQAVRHYVEQKKGATIRWMQLTENDNIPSRFWEKLTHTVSIDNPEFANKLRELGFPETASRFKQLLELTRTIGDSDKRFFVFDDFHTIYSKEILKFIERCAHIQNFRLSIIIISRAEPDINIIPLLSKDEAKVITEEDLRFTDQEVEAFFHYRSVPISAQSLSQLIDAAKGWALAINMFSSILKQTPTNINHALNAMKQNIFKLFEFEAWEGLSLNIQKTIVKVSLLTNLPIAPLQEIFKDIQSLQNIPELAAFIWYNSFTNNLKIHPLYLEFLQSKQYILSDDEEQEVYRLAAQWCSKNNFYMDAINYYAKTSQYDQMIQAFLSHPFKFSRDASQYFLDVLSRLKIKNEEQNNPKILFLKHYFTPLFLAGIGEYEQAHAYASTVIKEWEHINNTPLSNMLLRMSYTNLATIDMYLCIVTHRYKGTEYLQKAVEYFKQSSISIAEMIPPVKVGGAYINASLHPFACLVGQGASLSDFDVYLESARRNAELTDQIPFKIYAGYKELIECEYTFFRNELNNAKSHAYNAILKAQEYKQYNIAAMAKSYLLQIAMHEGDATLAKEILKQLYAYLNHSDFWNFQLDYDLYTSLFYAKIKMFEKIPLWLMMDEKEVASETNLPIRELIVTTLYYIACKKYHQALVILCNSYPREIYERYLFGEIRITLLTAVARIQTGDPTAAMVEFQKAYELSFNGKFELFFTELGKELHPLVLMALKQQDSMIPAEWLKQINRKASIYAKKVAVVAAVFKRTVDNEQPISLSDREQEVLVDLYHGLSREEIAINRHLSINTVKKVLQSIYTKLNANNSVDAIRIAIEKNLIK